MKRNFREMLEAQWAKGKCVCVGLDADWDKIPESVKAWARAGTGPGRSAAGKTLVEFCRKIVDQTKDLVCAYKPNAAFFESMGGEGYHALEEIVRYINGVAPEVPVIYDAKRADIGNTNAGYARSAFDLLGADAITVHPYLGAEALKPFLDQPDKGVIVLCRTSNPGAGEFQDLKITLPPEPGFEYPLYQVVAGQVAKKWNANGNCAVVVGATYPEELRAVREIVGDLPILIPGIGAQGGDVEKTVTAGKDSRGRGMIINSSRGIIFASNGEDFAEAARRETLKLHEEILKYC